MTLEISNFQRVLSHARHSMSQSRDMITLVGAHALFPPGSEQVFSISEYPRHRHAKRAAQSL